MDPETMKEKYNENLIKSFEIGLSNQFLIRENDDLDKEYDNMLVKTKYQSLAVVLIGGGGMCLAD